MAVQQERRQHLEKLHQRRRHIAQVHLYCNGFHGRTPLPLCREEHLRDRQNEHGEAYCRRALSGPHGGAGFAFLLSDAAFGDLPARYTEETSFAAVRVGDVVRINNNTHSVIILEKYSDYVIIAEGNYNSSIHWGRKLTAAQIDAADYILTRYPD
ncbi:MAG: hypothetical protein IJL78_06770 [Lachnospiraceae bacterium]|nr:hypothetical protein [Lachnospiraceae bacterium]